MIIEIWMNGTRYDITQYVNRESISISQTIDATLDSGSFMTNPLKKHAISQTLDLSRPFIRLSRVRITMDKEVYEFVVEEPKRDKVAYSTDPEEELYVHTVKIISQTALLQRRPIPDMTVTQGVGELGLFTRSAAELRRVDMANIQARLPGGWFDDLYINDDYRDPEFTTKALEVNGTEITVPFTISTQSSDPSVINNLTLVEANREYEINMTMQVWNIQRYNPVPEQKDEDARIRIRVYVGGVLQQTHSIFVAGGTTRYTGWSIFATAKDIIPNIVNINRTLKIIPTVPNQAIEIKVSTTGTAYFAGPVGGSGGPYTAADILWLKNAEISVASRDTEITEKIYLDQVVDKVLSIGKVGKEPEFVQGQNTRARLMQIVSPDYMWNNFYMWDALQEIAGYVGALITMNQRAETTQWQPATEGEFAGALNVIEINAGPESFMNYLNWFYANQPVGLFARRYTPELFDFVVGTFDEWNEGKTFVWNETTEALAPTPYTYDANYAAELPPPTALFQGARITVRDWLVAAVHTGDFGYIKARVNDLPTIESNGKKAIITGYNMIASDYSEWIAAFSWPWFSEANLAGPYDYEITNVNQLTVQTQANRKARLTQLAWQSKTYHLAQNGFIFSKYEDLPFTQTTQIKAVATGYNLVASDYSEWLTGFEVRWIQKSSLSSPYTYDEYSYAALPQPPANVNLRARVRVMNWTNNGYVNSPSPHNPALGFIQSSLGAMPFTTTVGTKALVVKYNLVTATSGEYAASNYKLPVTTPELPNYNDVWYAMMNQHTQYFNDLGQSYYAGVVIRTDDGLGNTYWKLEPAGQDDANQGYTLGSITTTYYLSENVEIKPRITVNIPDQGGIISHSDIWFGMQSQHEQLFGDMDLFQYYNGVIRTDDGLGNAYFKLQLAEAGGMRYYESQVTFQYYKTIEQTSQLRRTVTVGDGGNNMDDAMWALQNQHYSDFMHMADSAAAGLVLRADDGFGYTYYKLQLVQAIDNFLYYTSNIQRRYYKSAELLAGNRLTVTVPELPTSYDVMQAFKVQYPQEYEEIDLFQSLGGMVRSDDGLGNIYWKLSEIIQMYAKVVESSTQKPIVEFKFFDDMEQQIAYDAPNEKSDSAVAYFEDYVNAIEINAENIIGDDNAIKVEPYKGGWATLRAIEDGIAQITTGNLGFHTMLKQEKIRKLLIKGIAVNTASHSFPASTVWDITDRVLEKSYWDTLINQSDYTFIGRSSFNKNNTLYYAQGQNKIFNMSFTGTFEPQLIGQPQVIRALYEAVFAKATLQTNENVTTTDPGTTAADDQINIYIEYKQYSQSRTTIYKEDQSGFQTQSMKFYNETARLNEPKALGNHAQNIVNRMGGTNYSKTGIADNIGEIPKIGQPNLKGQVLVVRNVSVKSDHVLYTLNYVQDYAAVSNYVGVPSALRQFEIPMDDMVLRIDKYTEKIIFTDLPEYSDDTIFNDVKRFLNVLKNQKTPSAPTYAFVSFELKNGTLKQVTVPIDVIAMGKTLSINLRMKDNFSAGIKKYTTTINGVVQRWQEDVQYTDIYGRVEQLTVSTHSAGIAPTTARMNAYPLAIGNQGVTEISRVSYEIKKDAREIMAMAQEVTFLSETKDVIIYSGMARFNPLALQDTAEYNIKAAVLNYKPGKNSTIVDLSRITEATITTTVTDTELQIISNLAGQGIVYYEETSLELIMVVFTEGTTITKPYKVRR